MGSAVMGWASGEGGEGGIAECQEVRGSGADEADHDIVCHHRVDESHSTGTRRRSLCLPALSAVWWGRGGFRVCEESCGARRNGTFVAHVWANGNGDVSELA